MIIGMYASSSSASGRLVKWSCSENAIFKGRNDGDESLKNQRRKNENGLDYFAIYIRWLKVPRKYPSLDARRLTTLILGVDN